MPIELSNRLPKASELKKQSNNNNKAGFITDEDYEAGKGTKNYPIKARRYMSYDYLPDGLLNFYNQEDDGPGDCLGANCGNVKMENAQDDAPPEQNNYNQVKQESHVKTESKNNVKAENFSSKMTDQYDENYLAMLKDFPIMLRLWPYHLKSARAYRDIYMKKDDQINVNAIKREMNAKNDNNVNNDDQMTNDEENEEYENPPTPEQNNNPDQDDMTDQNSEPAPETTANNKVFKNENSSPPIDQNLKKLQQENAINKPFMNACYLSSDELDRENMWTETLRKLNNDSPRKTYMFYQTCKIFNWMKILYYHFGIGVGGFGSFHIFK